MKRGWHFLPLTYICLLIMGYSGCMRSEIPQRYKQAVLELKNQMENLYKIPLANRPRVVDKQKEIWVGTLNYKKRAEYLAKNRKKWHHIIALFDEVTKSKNLGRWKDDALFCRALVYVVLASTNSSIVDKDDVLSSITEFIEYKQDGIIERWTKNQLRSVFLGRMSKCFSPSLSEKINLNAFFYVAKGSLLQLYKGSFKEVVEAYRKASELDPNGFFGQEATRQIEVIKERNGKVLK